MCFDTDGRGFQWIIGDDAANSVFAFVRYGEDGTPPVIAICNFTPVPHASTIASACRVPVVGARRLTATLRITGAAVSAILAASLRKLNQTHGQPFSTTLTLPPLATVLLVWEGLIADLQL